MNPVPPSEYRQAPYNPGPSGPFQGDKLYVGLDVLLFIVNAVWSYMLIPARVDEAMKKMAETPNGAKVTPDMVQAYTLGFTGGCMCIGLIIYIFLWLNMIKGKKWAFITMIVFLILGILGSAFGMTGVGMPLAILGLVTGLAKLVYSIMRMIGKVGPALT